jgi:predicted  nucleic acid-binding Zn-ribbon protein
LENQLDLLERIQVIDLELKGAREFLDNFPRLLEELEAKRAAEDMKVADQKAAFEDTRKEIWRKERELEDGEDHMSKSQGRLYAAKSNKEYDAMLVEIDTQKQKNSHLEEEILLLYDQVDEMEQKIRDSEDELRRFHEDNEREKKDLQEERRQTEDRLGALQKERDKIGELVEPDVMATYTRIQQRLGDPALARAVDEVCTACHRRIPPQMYNEVLKGKSIIPCPNCQRILIYRETDFLAAKEA